LFPDIFPLGHLEKQARKRVDAREVSHHGTTHQVFRCLEQFFEV
jgi:hypothetical protein